MELDIKQVKTLYSIFKVSYQKKVVLNKKEVAGMICWSGNYFKISTNQTSVKTQLQTIMHETLHAIFGELKIDFESEKELDLLANTLVKFIQDNPLLIDAILKEGK